MPLVRISVNEKVAGERRSQLAGAVYDAMLATIGIPEGDRFVILTAHNGGELIADAHFMGMERTSEFVTVQITLRRGRSTEKKQALYREIARLFEQRASIAPDNVMIVLTENDLDDWSFGGGLAQYVLNPPAGARKAGD
jgi:4-oxalocrotonate tautomerase